MELRLEDLLGREVHGADGRRVGRIEEFRAAKDGEITTFVIGAAGLLERVGLGAGMLAGGGRGGRVARWDQIDLSDPERPRLKCPVEDLGRP
jgi:sporulation protein YlmC with PRC-barrel domain